VAEGCKNVFRVTLRPFSDAWEGKMYVRIGIPETGRYTKNGCADWHTGDRMAY
jgi:hypothetical protein